MKKIIAIVLTLVICVSAVSCGDNNIMSKSSSHLDESSEVDTVAKLIGCWNCVAVEKKNVRTSVSSTSQSLTWEVINSEDIRFIKGDSSSIHNNDVVEYKYKLANEGYEVVDYEYKLSNKAVVVAFPKGGEKAYEILELTDKKLTVKEIRGTPRILFFNKVSDSVTDVSSERNY